MGEDRAELDTHDVGFVDAIEKGESLFLQRCNTCAGLLAGFTCNEVPEALWVHVVNRQHVVCITVMCILAGLLGLLLKSLVP